MNPLLRLVGRQSLFFFGLGVLCSVTYPVAPAEFHGIILGAVGVAWFWAVMLGIENLLARRRGELGTTLSQYERPPPDTPFDPPPLERWSGRGR